MRARFLLGAVSILALAGCDQPHPRRSKPRRTPTEAEREFRKESEAALRSCREQTGQTTRQCIEQARRGGAS